MLEVVTFIGSMDVMWFTQPVPAGVSRDLSDVPTKQFILSLDARLACVVSDLDATHIFVKKDSVKEIQRELELLHEKNVYVRPR
ncbi:unnamed protein product [Pylaiella littoralis]